MHWVRYLWLMLLATPALAHQGTWQSAPDMATPRYAATATRLMDGKLLIAGGFDGNVTLTSSELYDPVTGTWASTGSLGQARNFAAATLLGNTSDDPDAGKVLIAGGFNHETGSLSSAELYDPATGQFTKLPDAMTGRRELFTATKLPNGKVLLVGGFRTGFGGGTLRTAELYDPSTRRFIPTGKMWTLYGRFGHAAILLPGTPVRVLIVGGKERQTFPFPRPAEWRSLDTAEIYDVARGRFTQLFSMRQRRDRPAVAWIDAVGKLLVVGGKAEMSGMTPSNPLPTEWFDPVTGQLSDGPSLNLGRMAHTLDVLPDGGLLAAGGWAEALGRTTETAERLVADAGAPGGWKWVWAGSTAADGTLQMMGDSRHDHASAVMPDGWVLIVGGKKVEGATTWLRGAEVYAP